MRIIIPLLTIIFIISSCGTAKNDDSVNQDTTRNITSETNIETVNENQPESKDTDVLLNLDYDTIKQNGPTECGTNTLQISSDPIIEVLNGEEIITELNNGYSAYSILCEEELAKFYKSDGAALNGVMEYIEVSGDTLTKKVCSMNYSKESGELESVTYSVNGELIKEQNNGETLQECSDLEEMGETFSAS